MLLTEIHSSLRKIHSCFFSCIYFFILHQNKGRQHGFKSEGVELIASNNNAAKLHQNGWEKLSDEKVRGDIVLLAPWCCQP